MKGGSLDLAEASVAVAIGSEISTFVSVILTSSGWSPRNTPSDSRTNSVQRQASIRVEFNPEKWLWLRLSRKDHRSMLGQLAHAGSTSCALNSWI